MKKYLFKFAKVLLLFSSLFVITSCSSNEPEELNKDEYYVKYTISSHGYEVSYKYTDAKGREAGGRTKGGSITIGPVPFGFHASLSYPGGVWKTCGSIEISKNGGVWMPVANAQGQGHSSFYCSYTINM